MIPESTAESAAESTTAHLDPTTHSYRWVMLGGVWLVYFCFGLTIAQMAPLVGDIKRGLGLNNSEMGVILGAWPLVYIATAIPCGALLDRIGPRRWPWPGSSWRCRASCAAFPTGIWCCFWPSACSDWAGRLFPSARPS